MAVLLANPRPEARVTDDLSDLLDEIDQLDDEEIWLLGDAWQGEDEDARRRAWAHAKKAIASAGRNAELDNARHEVSRWMQTSRTDFSGIQGLIGQAGGTVSGRQAAAPAIIDAAAAMLAGEALSIEDEDVLMRPWRALAEADRTDRDTDAPDAADAADGADTADGVEEAPAAPAPGQPSARRRRRSLRRSQRR